MTTAEGGSGLADGQDGRTNVVLGGTTFQLSRYAATRVVTRICRICRLAGIVCTTDKYYHCNGPCDCNDCFDEKLSDCGRPSTTTTASPPTATCDDQSKELPVVAAGACNPMTFSRAVLCNAVVGTRHLSSACCECRYGTAYNGTVCVPADKCSCRDPSTSVVYAPTETWKDVAHPDCIQHTCRGNAVVTLNSQVDCPRLHCFTNENSVKLPGQCCSQCVAKGK